MILLFFDFTLFYTLNHKITCFYNSIHDFNIKKGDKGRLLIHVLAEHNLLDNLLGATQIGLSSYVNQSFEQNKSIEITIPLKYSNAELKICQNDIEE